MKASTHAEPSMWPVNQQHQHSSFIEVSSLSPSFARDISVLDQAVTTTETDTEYLQSLVTRD